MALAAASAVAATIACAATLGVRPWPGALSHQVDVVPPPDATWSAPWEDLSRPPVVFAREGLSALLETATPLLYAVLLAAVTSLLLHAVSEVLRQWRSLAVRCALGAPFRRLIVAVVAPLWWAGAAGCAAGAVIGTTFAVAMLASRPALLTPAGTASGVVLMVVAVVTTVLLVLTLAPLALLLPLQRGVRFVADLHGDHATMRRPLLRLQAVLATLQLVCLFVIAEAGALALRSGVPEAPLGSAPPHAASLVAIPLRWTGARAADPAARAEGYRRLMVALEQADTHAVLSSPDAWVGVGKERTLASLCNTGCRIGLNLVAMMAGRVRMIAVGPETLTRMTGHPVRGREVGLADTLGGSRVAVLNGVAADRLFPNGRAIHNTLLASFRPEDAFDVVGIVRSVSPRGLGTGGGEPIVYVSLLQQPPVVAEVVADRAQAIRARDIVGRSGAQGLIATAGEPVPLAQRLGDYEAPLDWIARLLTALALLPALVAGVAVASTMTQLVDLRRREIAIRGAVGAPASRIVAWVLGRSLRVSLTGALIGWCLARWVGQSMREHVVGNPLDDLVTEWALIAGLVLLGVLASLRAARGAVRVEPAAAWAKPVN